MPEKDIARLQSVQNFLARVATKAPRFSRSVPILKRLLNDAQKILHSTNLSRFVVPRIKTKTGSSAFSISGPALLVQDSYVKNRVNPPLIATEIILLPNVLFIILEQHIKSHIASVLWEIG